MLWCVWAWKDQASFWRIVIRESRSGGVWSSIKYQTQASTLFLITVFFPSSEEGRYFWLHGSNLSTTLLTVFSFQMVSIWFRGPTYTPSMRMAVLGSNTIPADRDCVLVAGSAADTLMGNPYVFDHESLAREPRSYMSTRDLKEGSCAALRRNAVRSSAKAAIFV